MVIDVRSHGFPITNSLLQHVQRRIQMALGWASHSTGGVVVHLSDINGDHGGDDKSCQVHVKLARSNILVRQAIHRDMYVAIGKALEKARDAVARQLGRRKLKNHRESLRRKGSV